MRKLFIGGPGRSGTSLVAERLGAHPEVCSFPDVELKLFTEKNGLLDLWHALGESYSPNRAGVALQQFQRLCEALIEGQFGQANLKQVAGAEDWQAIFGRFTDELVVDDHPRLATADGFFSAAGRLLDDLAALASCDTGVTAYPKLFLEKTPHALLSMDFLNRLAPGAHFLHVMRDPRSIAHSVRRMGWGPATLAGCCAWVENYCVAWRRMVRIAKTLQIPFDAIRIEEVPAAPDELARRLCQRLGLSAEEDLFTRADLATLNGWAARCEPEDMELLNRRLGDWAERFGYHRAKIGCPASCPHESLIAAPPAPPAVVAAPSRRASLAAEP